MPRRRLALAREVLASLEPADLASVAGAIPISGLHPTCVVTSAEHSRCNSCQFVCWTNACPTDGCPPATDTCA